MAIYLVDNFKIGVKRLLDERTNVKTLQELRDLSSTFIPYGLIVHCDEDDNLYKFTKEEDEDGNVTDKWIQLTMSIEKLLFEYNEETDKYDIPIYVHNPKIIEHPIEEINDWIGINDGEHKYDILSKFINNDIVVSEKTWNTLKFASYKKEVYNKYIDYVENKISMVAKPTYTKVDSEEDMIETGKFYIMDPDGSGSYIIYVVTEEGETLSISSTNIDMSDYQLKNAPDLETDNKFILEAINEVNSKFSEQRSIIGVDDLIEGLDSSNSTILRYISDVYNKYIKYIGSTGNLTTANKNSIVHALNEIKEKLGDLKDLNDLIEKSSFVNSINNLYSLSQVRTGTIISYAGSTAPDGFLICDGSSLNTNDYPDLYDIIGTKYGVAPSGQFKVPNLKGMTIAHSNNANSALYVGSKGANYHHLSNEEMPSHTHTINSETHKHNNVTSDSAYRAGEKLGGRNGDYGSDGDSATGTLTHAGNHAHGWYNNCNASHKHDCKFYPSSQKGHDNLMPYITLNYIIKY